METLQSRDSSRLFCCPGGNRLQHCRSGRPPVWKPAGLPPRPPSSWPTHYFVRQSTPQNLPHRPLWRGYWRVRIPCHATHAWVTFPPMRGSPLHPCVGQPSTHAWVGTSPMRPSRHHPRQGVRLPSRMVNSCYTARGQDTLRVAAWAPKHRHGKHFPQGRCFCDMKHLPLPPS